MTSIVAQEAGRPQIKLKFSSALPGSGGGLTSEQVDDRVAALLQAGSNVTITYDDVANTLTIAATSGGGGLTAEEVDDRVAALLQQGDNVTLTYNDVANTLTISSAGGGGGGLTTEQVDDRVAGMLQAGSNITLTYDDAANTLTVATSALAAEQVDDRIATLLQAGSNITLTYNDVANTLTITGATPGLTAEEVDDRVASLLQAGSNITLTYNDVANTLTIAAPAPGLVAEDVDDRVATLLQAGSNVTLTYDDTANTLVIASGAGAGINASSEPLINGKLVASVASNALTVRLKTYANADPSGGDPVYVVFRNSDGTNTLRTITSAMSVVTAAGNAMSATSGVPFRLWVSMLDTAGTLSLFLTNATPTGSLVQVNDHTNPLIISRVLGHMDWNSGLVTAGQWAVVPTYIKAYGPGVKLPGEVIQSGSATCTGFLSVSTTSATNVPGMSVVLQPSSPCNKFNCMLWGSAGTETGPSAASFAAVGIRRGGALISASEALIGHAAVANITTGGSFAIFGSDAPGVTSSQQWTATIRSTASGNDSFFQPGGILSITEIMG